MVHVWDHFDYTQDVMWWKSQGWPLLKVILGVYTFFYITDIGGPRALLCFIWRN
jgi:alpha-L-fucosidase 2